MACCKFAYGVDEVVVVFVAIAAVVVAFGTADTVVAAASSTRNICGMIS